MKRYFKCNCCGYQVEENFNWFESIIFWLTCHFTTVICPNCCCLHYTHRAFKKEVK